MSPIEETKDVVIAKVLETELKLVPRYEIYMDGSLKETKDGRFYRVQDIQAAIGKIKFQVDS